MQHLGGLNDDARVHVGLELVGKASHKQLQPNCNVGIHFTRPRLSLHINS